MSAKSIKNILNEYLKGTEFKEINNTISAQTAWEKIVGKPISQNTKIKSLKNGIMLINVSNPIWRNELSIQKKELLEKLNKKEPELNINKIIFK